MTPQLLNVFDVETSALSEDKLALVKPEFTANKTLKDPSKIAEDLSNKAKEWVDQAALSATTGRVLCIGMTSGLVTIDIAHAGTEADIIERFWNWLELRLQKSETVAGFSIFHFDLPFLIRRSWALNVEVPKIVKRGRYWHDDMIDIHELWKCNNYDQRVSLDVLAKTLGIGAKSGSGADFAKLWETDRPAAIAYVTNDLKITRLCAERMLSIKPAPDFQPAQDVLS